MAVGWLYQAGREIFHSSLSNPLQGATNVGLADAVWQETCPMNLDLDALFVIFRRACLLLIAWSIGCHNILLGLLAVSVRPCLKVRNCGGAHIPLSWRHLPLFRHDEGCFEVEEPMQLDVISEIEDLGARYHELLSCEGSSC